mmetsp:Transcript_27545/g.46809  ORF Transcript_27545/g.46809 Transcript_27545/m.46809 type:complete len:82 (-) Transcript_27545:364-609(-)
MFDEKEPHNSSKTGPQAQSVASSRVEPEDSSKQILSLCQIPPWNYSIEHNQAEHSCCIPVLGVEPLKGYLEDTLYKSSAGS